MSIPCARCAGGGWVYAAGSQFPRPCPSCDGRGYDDGLAESDREWEAMRAELERMRRKLADLDRVLAESRELAAVGLARSRGDAVLAADLPPPGDERGEGVGE